MTNPTLDFRSAEDFDQQCRQLAQAYCRQWAAYWPKEPDAVAVDADPGLVLLKLFSLLGGYLADTENAIPQQRRLAFYQFVDLALRPPVSARTVLAFVLRDGQDAQTIPSASAVLDAATQRIRFQTEKDLLVVPAVLGAALTILPAQDLFVNVAPSLDTTSSVPIFTSSESDPAEKPLGHWFLLGNPTLFQPNDGTRYLSLTFTGENLRPEFFGQWFDGNLTPLLARVAASADSLRLDVSLQTFPAAEAVSLATVRDAIAKADGGPAASPDIICDDDPDCWLIVKPAPQVRVLTALARRLPVITAMTITLTGGGISPQQTVSNQVPVDLVNGGYPFGQTPAVNDAFYIRNDDVLARSGAEITVTFGLRTVACAYPVKIVWQYWDGSTWQSFNAIPADIDIHQFVDTTSNLQHNNPSGPTIVAFICPDIPESTVAGSRGRWIRAVIADGGYGTAASVTTTPVAQTIDAVPADILPQEYKAALSTYLSGKAGVGFSYHYTPATYAPPFITALSLGYRETGRPDRLWTDNALDVTRFLFNPFKPVADTHAGFHFGFADDGFADGAIGQTLSLFFDLAEQRAVPATGLVWQAYVADAWSDLDVDDGTSGLTRSGIVSFVVPATITAATLFSVTQFWFRVNDTNPNREVRVRGLYPNGVWAANTIGVDDEVLGSSDEQPSQVFVLDNHPVLDGMTLTVTEPQGLEPEDGPLTVTPPDTDPTTTGQAARVWTRVDSFAGHGPSERVYTLDSANGRITFGDGRNGMIPPIGEDNIIATHYDSTQGIAGNVAAQTLTVLRPGIANIDAVRNPMAAFGGVDGDSRDDIERTGASRVRTAGRGLDRSDYAVLAETASPCVARATALVEAGPRIRIPILPRADTPRPYADPGLIDTVNAFVRARCAAVMARRVVVSGADYRLVDVTAQVTATVSPDQRLAFRQKVEERLARFLHPVFGGTDGLGWAFGQTVRAVDVARALRQIPEVSAVRSLALNGVFFGDTSVAADQVAAAGTMSVYVYGEGNVA